MSSNNNANSNSGRVMRPFPTTTTYDHTTAGVSNIYTRRTTRNAFNPSTINGFSQDIGTATFFSTLGPLPGNGGGGPGPGPGREAGSQPTDRSSAANNPAFRPGATGRDTLLSELNAVQPGGQTFSYQRISRFDEERALMRDMLRRTVSSRQHFNKKANSSCPTGEAKPHREEERQRGQQHMSWHTQQAQLLRVANVVDGHEQKIDRLRVNIQLGKFNQKLNPNARVAIRRRFAQELRQTRFQMLKDMQAEKVPKKKVIRLLAEYKRVATELTKALGDDCALCPNVGRPFTPYNTRQCDIDTAQCPKHPKKNPIAFKDLTFVGVKPESKKKAVPRPVPCLNPTAGDGVTPSEPAEHGARLEKPQAQEPSLELQKIAEQSP